MHLISNKKKERKRISFIIYFMQTILYSISIYQMNNPYTKKKYFLNWNGFRQEWFQPFRLLGNEETYMFED